MHEEELGLGGNLCESDFDPLADWWKPWHGDARLRKAPYGDPTLCGGRRMSHPVLQDIVYARTPDRTLNFEQDVLPRPESILTKTALGTAHARYDETPDDVVIKEIWLAQELSTLTTMFRQFYAYWVEPLPTGLCVGWQPRDRTWKRYAVEILKVECGESDDLIIESLGRGVPKFMRFNLTVSFKTVREVYAPSGVVVATGA